VIGQSHFYVAIHVVTSYVMHVELCPRVSAVEVPPSREGCRSRPTGIPQKAWTSIRDVTIRSHTASSFDLATQHLALSA